MDTEIRFGECSSRVARPIPDCNRARDAEVIVLGAWPSRRFALNRRAVEPGSSWRIDAPVLLVSWRPFGEAEVLSDVVLADNRIVAGKRMHEKVVRRAGLDAD